MDVVSREVLGGLPWEFLYSDDLVLMAESESELKQFTAEMEKQNGGKGLVFKLMLEILKTHLFKIAFPP